MADPGKIYRLLLKLYPARFREEFGGPLERLALGALAGAIAGRLGLEVFWMVFAGAVAGLTLGMVSVRYIETLLYGVKATVPRMLVFPSLTILAAALLASLPAVIRAMRIDPIAMLRSE